MSDPKENKEETKENVVVEETKKSQHITARDMHRKWKNERRKSVEADQKKQAEKEAAEKNKKPEK